MLNFFKNYPLWYWEMEWVDGHRDKYRNDFHVMVVQLKITNRYLIKHFKTGS